MQLRTKLTFILAFLVVTLATNVGLSIWSIRFLEHQLSTPLRSMEAVMKDLYMIKRVGEREIDLLTSTTTSTLKNKRDSPTPPQSAHSITSQITTMEQQTSSLLDDLQSRPSIMQRAGITTIDNLRNRSLLISEANLRYAESQNPDDARALIAIIDTRHELIERVEGRILDDTQLEADFGQSLKARMYTIILASLLGALTIGLLMVMLIRRWVLFPIDQLRTGARMMSSGNFGHTIPVRSSDELGQLAKEFNLMGTLIEDMQARAIERERLSAMGEMAQRTAHNFRTPLAGIRALSESTRDDLDEGSELRDFQDRIIDTVDRFEIWLNEMLRASAPLELTTVALDPVSLVTSIINTHQPAASTKHQTIEFINDLSTPIGSSAPPIDYKGDPHHLEHAITAVLSNALDYAPDGSTISVHLSTVYLSTASENNQPYWTLQITNQGEPIPQELHRSIFRPYFTTRRSGTGIGLAMTKRVIDQHSGRIEVTSPLSSSPETGCAFKMTIPAHPVTGINGPMTGQ